MSRYSTSKSTGTLTVDFYGLFPHDSVTLTYPIVTVTTRQQDLSVHVRPLAILCVVAIAAVCFIFLLKRIVDHRRHALMETADYNRTLESDIPEIGLQTVSTYGQYLNNLRMEGCSRLPNQPATVSPRPNITVDMPPSYDMATKYSILSTAPPCGFANTGYAASESCLVLPPSYVEATKNLSLATKDIIASDHIAVEQQSVRSSNCATHDDHQTTSVSPDSQASVVEVRIHGATN